MHYQDVCQLSARSKRQIGIRRRLGDTARIHNGLASAIKAHHTWDPRKTLTDTDHGGVFNFDFSKNGSLLGVACERKSVLLFDPLNGKLVASKTNAHTDCVNCVKFLDDRLFATCSDDTTVALWDTRYLKHNVRTFHGHSNWVKNIEYDSKQGILVTSGFDGCIYTWNINKYSNEESSNKVFYTSGLMRSKLSPDFTKLLISTHEGYIIVIHNLDLSTLGEDLKGFKPNMYRLMQRSQTPLRIGLLYNHVFEQERNRVEFITDWPTGNDANIVSSLQVHPQGWCVLSRNTDSTENAEWTCVHNIQDDNCESRPKDPAPWLSGAPHTSSSYCSSTNTPAFSSVAPSNLPHLYNSLSTNQSASDNSQDSSTNERPRNSPRTRRNLHNSSSSYLNGTNQSAENENENNRVTNDNSANDNSSLLRETETVGTSAENENSSQRSDLASNQNTQNSSPIHTNSEPVEASQTVVPSEPSVTEAPNTGNTNNSTSAITGDLNATANEFERETSPRNNANEDSNDSESSNEEVLQPRFQIIRGSHNAPVTEPNANPRLGRLQDSLIQIRRGSRNDDGQFSFSISVHTASGRTIEFNQSDLESDDEDEDIAIEQIIASAGPSLLPTSSESASASAPNSNMLPSSENEDINTLEDNTDVPNGSEHDLDSVEELINRESDQNSEDETVNENGLYTIDSPPEFDDNDGNDFDDNNDDRDYNEDDYDSLIGGSDDEDTLERNTNSMAEEFYRAAVGNSAPDMERDELEDLQQARDSLRRAYNLSTRRSALDARLRRRFEVNPGDINHDLDEGSVNSNGNNSRPAAAAAHRRAIEARLRRRLGVNADDVIGERDEETDPDQSSSVNTNANNSSPVAAGGIDTRPRTNTFMFVLQSNSGDRRRRILNLSYMDSYTERENNLLQKKIHMNKNRLLGYVEECNVGRGFIKELAFSSDGRLVSSPFGFGLRIFAFDSYCNELCDTVPTSPVKLYEVTCSLAHVNCVVATKFSPIHNLVVSGCLDGKIAFHQPVL